MPMSPQPVSRPVCAYEQNRSNTSTSEKHKTAL